MTRFNRLSIVTLGAVLSMTAGLAFAGDTVSADKIVRALKPTSPTRGLSVGPQVDTAKQAKETSFIDTLRNRKEQLLRSAYMINARDESHVTNYLARQILESAGKLPN